MRFHPMKAILVVVGILLLLGGGVWFWQERQAADVSMTPQGSEEAPNTEAPKETAPSVISSIKDAMGLGQQMRCTYAAEVGGKTITSTVYVKGQKFKSESEVGGMKVQALFDGETQYVWNSGSKQGFQFTKACMENLKASVPETVPEAPTAVKPENYDEVFEAAKNVRCEATGDGDFAVPEDITFTDQCAMMEQSQKMMEQAKKMMPQGSYPGQ